MISEIVQTPKRSREGRKEPRTRSMESTPTAATTTPLLTPAAHTAEREDEGEQRVWVLSVQSFVVHGYVGNKCSMLALQTLGIDVDPLCTVVFSNHTGYPEWRGLSLTASQLGDMVHGLAHPAVGALQRYTHVVSGYCRDAESLLTIARTVEELRRERPDLVYLCDPVMGDDGSLYVPQAVADTYRTSVVRLADIVKLNQTEAETLTGVRVHDLASVAATLRALHAMGPRTAVLSSCRVADRASLACLARALGLAGAAESDEAAAQRAETHMFVFGSDKGGVPFVIGVRVLDGYFSGTGDLFSALLLGWLIRGCSTADACVRTVAALQSVLRRTAAAHSFELLLVQSRHDIECPCADGFVAVPIPSLL